MKIGLKKTTILSLKYIVLITFSIVCLYPIIWMFLASFKTNDELYINPWGLPEKFRLDNYIRAIVEGNVGTYYVNSIIITGVVLFVSVCLSCMASYAITRMNWKCSKIVLNIFLLGMFIPVHATIVPLFSLFKTLRLLNTRLAVIISHIAFSFPMAIFIMTGFLSTIPRDIEEAAVMDGCSIYRIFLQIIFPISKSSIVTVAVIIFINSWNDLLLPQIFLTDRVKMPLPVGLTEFRGEYSTDYVSMIAAVVLVIIPSIIVYILLHKNIMEGMIAGAVKG